VNKPDLHNRIQVLISKYLTDDLSGQESIELNQFLEDPVNQKLFEQITDPNWMAGEVKIMNMFDTPASLKRIWEAYPSAIPKASIPIWKYAAVAAVLIIALTAGWLYLKNGKENKLPQLAEVNENASRRFRALLKTSYGLDLNLDEIANGMVSYTGSGAVIKNDNQLLFPRSTIMAFRSTNLVMTENGGYYRVQLPDGSKVWLNSTSSIDFPSSFIGNERNVIINGEAYFDIADDVTRPFKVQTSDMEVQVTGTKFNIRAYKEEQVIRTTLYEGSVKVSAGEQVTWLSTGEEAVFTRQKTLEKKISNKETLEKAIAWKEGKFNFDQDDLSTIIRELGRWYDYEVDIPPSISKRTYTGSFKRSRPITDIIEYVERLSGHDIDIKGKKIIVKL
jgi:transmembrane sensor